MKTFKQFLLENNEHDNRHRVGGEKYAVKHDIPMSHLSDDELNSKSYKDQAKRRKYPINKIRATQGYVDSRWKPKKTNEGAYGLEDKDGNVHIKNGHHRINNALKRGDKHYYVTTNKEEPDLPKHIKEYTKKVHDEHGVKLDVKAEDGHFAHINHIHVPKEKRRQGIGTKVLDGLHKIVDDNQAKLSVSPHEKHEKFFKSRGYFYNKNHEENGKKHYKDHSIPGTMGRNNRDY